MNFNEWQFGKRYFIAKDGIVMARREYGVKLGTVRIFLHSTRTGYDTPVKYYAERKFRSIIPFRAPNVWWRILHE